MALRINKVINMLLQLAASQLRPNIPPLAAAPNKATVRRFLRNDAFRRRVFSSLRLRVVIGFEVNEFGKKNQKSLCGGIGT